MVVHEQARTVSVLPDIVLRELDGDGRSEALFEERVVLEARGTHGTVVQSRFDVYEADVREGYSANRRSESPQVIEFDEGTILVDIADAENKQIIWRGWAQFDITRALADPEVMERAIEEAIRKMFEHFPPE